MVKKTGLVLIILMVCIQCKNETSKTKLSIDDNIPKEELAAKYFSEVSKLSDIDNNELWGVSLSGSMMLIDENTRELFANEGDSIIALRVKNNIYSGILPDTIPLANTAFQWEGKVWTMLLLPLPENQLSRANLLMHESFHRIQPQIGFDFTKIEFYSCDHLNETDGRIYLKLELEALKKAIKETSVPGRFEHIKNAILFRAYRHYLYKRNVSSENALELLEGLAEYTGLALSGRSKNEIEKHFVNSVNEFYTNATFVRSFAYHTIPGYGYLMSLENKKWNQSVNINTNLTEFIKDFYSIEIPTNLEDIISTIKYDYNYDLIIQKEEEITEKKKEKVEAYKSKFFNNPTLILFSENLKYSIDPRNVFPLEHKGTVYSSISVSAEWGKLEVDEDVFINNLRDTIIVSAPTSISEHLVKGQDWKLNLNRNWEVIYSKGKYILKKK